MERLKTMKQSSRTISVLVFLLLTIYSVSAQVSVGNERWEREPGFTYPVITEPYTPQPFKPRQYVIYRTIDDIFIDGKLDESSWENAEWTDNHVHIVFEGYKNPNLNTRSKMVWDDRSEVGRVSMGSEKRRSYPGNTEKSTVQGWCMDVA